MGRILFIADLHFGDDNIRRYENRPFDNVKQMDENIIHNWNMKVNPNDHVYILGDFGANGYEKEVLSKMYGYKYLIKGNHDIQSNEYYRNSGFTEVYDHPIILEDFWILSHEPIYVNSYMPYANIFGHVHGSPIYKDYSSQHYCVSYERNNRPVYFETIKDIIKNSTK